MTLVEGFIPGALGRIVELHARYYALEWSFGTYFETKVASELSAFARRYDPATDLVLLALIDDVVHGSLVLDLNDPANQDQGAHLRWFISSDESRGTGLGGRMMQRAMTHVDAHADGRCWLTTFAGLAPARALYEKHGFAMVSEVEGQSYGISMREQTFKRHPE